MAKKRTFQEELIRRAQAFRPLKNAAARRMRETMRGLRQDALTLVQRNMAAYRRTGRYVDSAAAIARAQETVVEMQRLLDARLSNAGRDLVSFREQAYRRGVADISQSIAGLPRDVRAEMALTFGQVDIDAAVAARTRPSLGILPNQAFNGVRGAAPQQVRDILSNAIVNQESVAATAQRLTEAMDMSRHAAERIVRTNMTAAYADAAKLYYESRPEVFSGYRWEAIMDDRTSPTCLMLHGSFWPLGATTPGPPAHWNCRSILIGVFRNQELEQVQEEGTRSVREYKTRKDGTVKELSKQVPIGINPETWLRGQPARVVQDTLGSSMRKDAFLRRGDWSKLSRRVGLDDMVTPDLQLRNNRLFFERVYALSDNADKRVLRGIAKEQGLAFKKLKSASAVARESREAGRAAFEQPTEDTALDTTAVREI